MMNIIVTGGVGFVGTNLIKRLLSEGHNVTSIDNYSTGLKENEQKGCVYINGDITDKNLISKYFTKDIDVCFHLAGIARIQPSFKNPIGYFETNANGTLNIAQVCSDYNIHMVYAGSSSHHGGKFKNPYTFSKDVGENIVDMYGKLFKLTYTIARFYNVYGDHQLLGGEYSTLIGRWLYNIQNDIPCEIYGDGEQTRDFTHVDDIVDGLIRMMNNVYAYNEIFELGRGQSYSVNEVADMFGITPIHKVSKRGEMRDTFVTDSRANEILRWNPKINLKDYIDEEISKSKVLG